MSWSIALVAYGAFSAVKAGMTYVQTRESAAAGMAAAEMELIQLDVSEEQAKVAALDQEVQRRQQLTAALGRAEAQAASQGQVIGLSPSFGAIQATQVRDAGRDITRIRILGANRLFQIGSARTQKRLEFTSYQNLGRSAFARAFLSFGSDMSKIALLGAAGGGGGSGLAQSPPSSAFQGMNMGGGVGIP